MDIVLTPDLASLQLEASTSIPPFWINETAVRSAIANSSSMVGSAPRWTLVASGLNPKTLRRAPLVVLVCDSIREQQIGAGRTWQRRPLVSGADTFCLDLLKVFFFFFFLFA
jgi:hypothetical protein